MHKKIKTQKQLLQIVNKLKKQHKKIVTYNGSFDILHLGHIRSIQDAKKQGDILIILLNSDNSIKKYKGSKKPLIPENERAETLANLETIDYITIFDEINPKKILSEIKPNVHCNGSDWGKNCIESSTVKNNGGKLHIIKWEKGLSTTNLINKILKVYSTPTIKAVFLDRDGTINNNKNGYIYNVKDFSFIPNSIKALKLLSKTTFKIIIITNQSGIGRHYYTEKDFQTLNKWLLKTFKSKKIRIDKIYHCPHLPTHNCDCRKPKIGMLLKAVKDFGISLSDSWLIGDEEKDILAGRESNSKTIKIGKENIKDQIIPKYYAKDLLNAIKIILKNNL